MPSTSTSAYCQARKNLYPRCLNAILDATEKTLNKSENNWNGRRVIVVDGTGLTMPDTPENQKEFPQQKHQKFGCGFP